MCTNDVFNSFRDRTYISTISARQQGSDQALQTWGPRWRAPWAPWIGTIICNVGIAIINHPFLMVYTTHLWWLGAWFIIAIPRLAALATLPIKIPKGGPIINQLSMIAHDPRYSFASPFKPCKNELLPTPKKRVVTAVSPQNHQVTFQRWLSFT